MTKKFWKKYKFIAVFLTVFCLMLATPVPVLAQGVRFGPAHINISVEGPATEERTIAVINQEKEAILLPDIA